MQSRLWPAWVAAFTEGACLSVILFLLPLYAAKTFGTHSLAATQAIVAVPALVTILASNLWGAGADVLGRTFPLVATSLGCYAATFWALSRAHSLSAALAIVVIGACGYAGAAPLVRSHVTLFAGGDAGSARRGRALGVLLLAETLGLALANGVASGRYDATRGADAGMTPILLGIGGLAACGAVIVAFAAAREPQRPREVTHGGWTDALFGDLREVYTVAPLRTIVLVALPTFAGQFVYVSTANLLLRDHWHLAAGTVAKVLAIHAVLGLSVFPLAGRLADKHGGRRVLALGAVAQTIKFAMLWHAPTAAAACVCAVLPAFPLVTTGSAAAIAETSRVSKRAGGMGVLMGSLSAGAAIGPLSAGLVADRFGLGATPLLASAFAALTVAASLATGFFTQTPAAPPAPTLRVVNGRGPR